MAAKNFYLGQQAKTDLEEIWLYISNNSSSEIADRVITELYKSMQKLALMPHIGRKRPEFTEMRSLAFWPTRHYLIVYLPDTEPIEIVRVLHTSRDILTALKSF